jgi:hypothetical protein
MNAYDRAILIRGFNCLRRARTENQTRFYENGLRFHCEHIFALMMDGGVQWDS